MEKKLTEIFNIINNGVVDYTQEVFNNAELATFFKAIHRLSKKTCKDICQQTGYHPVQIRAHETNKQTFSLKFLQQICDVFDLSFTFTLTSKTDEKNVIKCNGTNLISTLKALRLEQKKTCIDLYRSHSISYLTLRQYEASKVLIKLPMVAKIADALDFKFGLHIKAKVK